MAEPRDFTPWQRRWVAFMTGLSLFAAGVWYDKVPTGDLVLGALFALGVMVAVPLFWPASLRAPLPQGQSLHAAGPRELLPNLLTLMRAFCGLAAAFAATSGQFERAYWLYMAGNASDIMDGHVARTLGGATATGKRYDAVVDMLFNLLTGLGLGWVAVRSYPALDWPRLTALAVNVVGFAVAMVAWGPHTAPAKYMSGTMRVILLGLVVSYLPPGDRLLFALFGAAALAFGFTYEYFVVQADKSVSTAGLSS